MGDGQFNTPDGISVASAGSIYVSDYFNHRIQKLTSEGVFVSRLKGNPMFYEPGSVAVASDGSVYVGDTNNYIQKFFVWP